VITSFRKKIIEGCIGVDWKKKKRGIYVHFKAKGEREGITVSLIHGKRAEGGDEWRGKGEGRLNPLTSSSEGRRKKRGGGEKSDSFLLISGGVLRKSYFARRQRGGGKRELLLHFTA